MPSLIERRSEIVRQTESRGKVKVEELARQLKVSQVTIRNDLNALSSKGLIVRSRGGAVASTRLTRELSVEQKYKDNLAVKRGLGRGVADLIGPDARTIAIDSGTTAEEVALSLRERSNLTIMTNGLNIATALSRAKGIEVLMTGGMLRKKSMSFYGEHAEASVRHMHFETFVLGADGIDAKVGVTTYFGQEASLNRKLLSMAGEVILVADSSKFGKRCPHIICGLDDVNVLVTDSGIPGDMIELLSERGVDVRTIDDTRQR